MHKCDLNSELISKQIQFNGIDYNYTICNSCGLVQTKPCIPQTEDIYETGHYEVKAYTWAPMVINFLDYLYITLIILFNGLGRGGYILDFGCGKGFFIYLLKIFKFKKVFGVETSPSRAAFSKKLTGLPIGTEYYSGGKILDQSFDCITMIHVLEHIENPFDFLSKLLADAVDENGFVLIEVPNINSLASLISGTVFAHFTPHFHVNHFTILSFRKFCLEKGLTFKLVSTFSFYNSAMGMTSAFLSIFGYTGSLFEDLKKKKIIIIFAFLIFLPLTILTEIFVSFFKQGSVIKCIIKK